MSRPPSQWTRIVALAIGPLLAACTASSTSPTLSPSDPSSSVAGESVAESVGDSALPFPVIELPPDSLATVPAPLDLYTAPGEPTDGTLDGGQVLLVAGPRDKDGETWYQVQLMPASDRSVIGWVLVRARGDLVSADVVCPAAGADPLTMLAWDRVRCLTGQTVTIEGRVGHCQGGVVQAEPEWLAYACWAVSTAAGAIDLHAPPERGIVFPDNLVRARMTGHFDDPAAPTCVFNHDPSTPAWLDPSPGEQIFLCREAFVADSFEILEDLGPQVS